MNTANFIPITMHIVPDGYKVAHTKSYDPAHIASATSPDVPVSERKNWICQMHWKNKDDCHALCPERRHDSYDALMNALREKYGEPIGEGRHRITFESKHVVIKMPKNMGGVFAGPTEYHRYKRKDPSERDRLARCRMVTMFDVPVIIMEKLRTDIDYRTKPPWAFEYDCGQIGLDKHGHYKAYDYTTI